MGQVRLSYIRWQTVPEPRCYRSECSVAKSTLCVTDDHCSTVGRTQSSDADVADESAVVSQVAWDRHRWTSVTILLSDTVLAAPICEFAFSELRTSCSSWVTTLQHGVMTWSWSSNVTIQRRWQRLVWSKRLRQRRVVRVGVEAAPAGLQPSSMTSWHGRGRATSQYSVDDCVLCGKETDMRRRRVVSVGGEWGDRGDVWVGLVVHHRICRIDAAQHSLNEVPSLYHVVCTSLLQVHSRTTNNNVVAWLSDSAFDSINVVTLRRARLILGWVTVGGRLNRLYM